MSKLLVIRHGQARLFTNNYDRLSDLGIQQAECLGEWFVERGIAPDAIYAGSLKRQRQTADAVRKVLTAAGKPATDLQVLEGLNEYPAVDIMRQLVPELRTSVAEIDCLADEYDQSDDYDIRYRSMHQLLALTMKYWINGEYDRTTGLLAWEDFSSGVHAALVSAMKIDGRGKTVAVFTSGGPAGISVQSVLEAPALMAAELNWRIYNCSVTQFTFSGERLTLDSFNETAHLSPEMLTFR
jgi:broad specificity phosphatase PhoE